MENKLIKGVDHVGVSVVFFCHDGKGKFIMAKRSNNARDEQGKWDIGAGGIEFGQTVEDTLKKEIREEYCTDVINAEFLGYRTVIRENNNKKSHWVTFDFKVLVNSVMVKNGEPHKFEALDWFTFETMPVEIHSQIPNFLNLYKSKLTN